MDFIKSNALKFVFTLPVVLFMVGGPVFPVTVYSAEVGDANPVSPTRYGLFSDDELLWIGSKSKLATTIFHEMIPTKNTLQAWDSVANNTTMPWGSVTAPIVSYRSIASAPGNITACESQDAVYAYFNPTAQDLTVGLFYDGQLHDRSTPIHSTAKDNRTLDLIVGDLDFQVDDNGCYHDEIVVVRSVDRGSGTGLDFAIDIFNQDLETIAFDSWSPGFPVEQVAAAIGDFDGDQLNELAVAMSSVNSWNNLIVAFYRFQKDADGIPTHSLARITTTTVGGANTAMDMTAGDFNGDRIDELFLVHGNGSYANPPATWAVIQANANLGVKKVTKGNLEFKPQLGELRVVSGLFHFDVSEGYDVNTNQVAVCELTSTYTTWVNCVFYHLRNLVPVSLGAWDFSGGGSPPDAVFSGLDVTVGNFIGHGVTGTANSPAEQLAVTYHEKFGYTENTVLRIAYQQPGSNFDDYYENKIYNQSMPTVQAVTAVDIDGDTWRLGRPAHFVLDDVVSLDAEIQEPPKHVDYLPVNPDDPEDEWEWEIFNIGGLSEFSVKFEDKQSQSTESTRKDRSTSTIGGGVSLDISESFTYGYGVLEKITFSAEDKLKVDYEYDSNSSSYNSSFTERTSTYSCDTPRDDNLELKYQDINIWRYPILGYETGNPDLPVGMYELIIPSANPTTVKSGGMNNADFYQPIHQNHNILSYLQFSATAAEGKWIPTDVGSFKIPDTSHPGATKTVTDIMNSGATYFWNGNAYEESLEWSAGAGSGSEKEWNNSLSESDELTLGVSGKVALFPGTMKFNMEMGLSFNNKNTWGGAKVGETKNSNSSGIKIVIPGGEEGERGYAFRSAVYVSKNGGTFKVAHATNPTASSDSSDWWKKEYGRKPDPALNLPRKFIWRKGGLDGILTEHWVFNQEESRKFMRGFFIRNATVDPVSGKHELLGESLVDGDTVLLCARVYNYSLSKPTGGLRVTFYYVPWDTEEARAVGEPTTQPGMTNAFANIVGIQNQTSTEKAMKEICVPFDTTGLADQANPAVGYRFLVHLDEPDLIDEIHEQYDENGNELPDGNNEGMWPWHNAVMIHSNPDGQTKSAGGSGYYPDDPDLWMHEDSLAIETDDGLETGDDIRVEPGRTYRVRARIHTSDHHHDFHHVLFYEGNPEAGGRHFSTQVALGLKESVNYVWAAWTPNEPGEYDLHALVLEDSDDPNPEDTWDTLYVTVLSEDDDNDQACGCNVSQSIGSAGLSDFLLLIASLITFLLIRRPCLKKQ